MLPDTIINQHHSLLLPNYGETEQCTLDATNAASSRCANVASSYRTSLKT